MEEARVNLMYLNIIIKQHETDTELFIDEKDKLLEGKKEAEQKNEALKKESLAKQEIEAKRLLAMLNKNKNIETKELLA